MNHEQKGNSVSDQGISISLYGDDFTGGKLLLTNSEANDILGRELGAVAYIVFCWILCKIGGYQWRRYCRADTKIVSTRLNVNEPSILKQPLWGKYD